MIAYNYRIMARLVHDVPIELHRSRATFYQKTYDHWTRDMDSAWDIWVEHRLSDWRCVSPRIKLMNPGSKTVLLRRRVRCDKNELNGPTSLPSRINKSRQRARQIHQPTGAIVSNGHLDNPSQVVEQEVGLVIPAQT